MKANKNSNTETIDIDNDDDDDTDVDYVDENDESMEYPGMTLDLCL